MRLRAVIFDLDGTLIRSRIDFKKMKSLIIDFLEGIGVTRGLLSNCMLNFEILRLATDDLRRKGVSEEEIRRFTARVTNIMNRVELESWNESSMMGDVPETLRALKSRGLKIGIITNSCREYAEKVLNKFRLLEHVDAIAARDDVEKPKPNREHALHLLRLLKVSTDETLFVGDHSLDAECAEKSRLKFILIRRRDQKIEDSNERRYQSINSIKEIVNIIDADR